MGGDKKSFKNRGLKGGKMEFLVKIFVSILGFIGGEYINIGGVDISLVNKGNGLYNENAFYVYKGFNPNNYVVYNNEMWRIMSIDNGLMKIIRNESIGNMAFDENDSNEWELSSVKRYLNDYYDNIDDKYKEINDGRITLMSMDDYLEANSNLKMCGTLDLYFKNDERCFKTNYINNITKGNASWTLTKEEDTVFYVGNTYFSDIRPSDSDFGVLPVLYLDKNIELYGEGSLQNPYKIKI